MLIVFQCVCNLNKMTSEGDVHIDLKEQEMEPLKKADLFWQVRSTKIQFVPFLLTAQLGSSCQCLSIQVLLQAPLEDFAAKYGCKIDPRLPKQSFGLSTQQALESLEKHGPNAFTPPNTQPEWLRFLLQFTDPFMVRVLVFFCQLPSNSLVRAYCNFGRQIMLMVAGGLSFLAYGLDTNQPINLCTCLELILVFCLPIYFLRFGCILNGVHARHTAT